MRTIVFSIGEHLLIPSMVDLILSGDESGGGDINASHI